MDPRDGRGPLRSGTELPPLLVEGFLRLSQGDFGFRLPRDRSRDATDTAAFLFNSIADELNRIVESSREQEQRLNGAVARISEALTRVAAGDFGVQVERDFRADELDALAFLVNGTIVELRDLVADRERRTAALEAMVEDRTRQLRQSEESFRRLFDAAPVPMVLVSTGDATIRSCNQRAATMLAARSDELAGRPLVEIFEALEERDRLLEQLRHDGSLPSRAVRLVPRYGKPFWTLLQASVLELEDGSTLVLSFADLSEQKETEDRLRELATMDALTGLMNRRHFLALAAEELERAARYSRPLCMALFDADHFKQVNDQFGHIAGDEALRRIADSLRQQLRKQDRLGRYGGEEFAVVLPETTLEGAQTVIERCRQAVASAELVRGGQRVNLTVSAGLVVWRSGESLESCLQRADAALYAAKGAGRNRVATASP